MGERADEVTASDARDESKQAARPVQTDEFTTGAPGKVRAPGKASKDRASGGPVGKNQMTTDDDELSEGQETSTPSEDEEIAAAQIDIEQTRVEMSETIDAIEEKLSPEHLTDRAKESVKQATLGKAQDVLGRARRRSAERASTVTSAARRTGSAAAQRVKQKPIPVAAVGIGLTGLALGARMMQGRRERSKQGSQASYAASGGAALNSVQRTVGQVFGQTQRAATRIAGRDLGRVNEQGTESADQGWLPSVVIDLVVGLGLAVALGALRRRRSTAGPSKSLLGLTKRGQSPPPGYARSTIVKRLLLVIATAVPAGMLAAKRFRPSTGQEKTMTRADLVMAWLNTAYSMETGLVHTLQSHAKDAQDFPQVQTKIQQHVEETRRHADLITECIKRLGGTPSKLKSTMATVVGKAQGVAARPAQDTAVKNALADFSAEQLEISSYKALIAAAQDLGDQETVSICQQILQDEEEMARFLDQNLPTVATETMHRMPAAVA